MEPSPLILLTVLFLLLLNGSAAENSACKLAPTYTWVADICDNGYAIRCNNSNLRRIPKAFPKFHNSSKLCLLDLSKNRISKILNNSFIAVKEIKMLFLYQNNLSFIDSGAFSNLTNLVFLNISSNLLHYPHSFGKGVFRPLESLTYLNIKNNSISTYIGLDNLLWPLRQLEALYISGCYNCTFGKGFESFTKLTNVSLSGTTDSNLCNISVLFNNTFIHLPKVENVFMSSCNIERVEEWTSKSLKNIGLLDISYNDKLQFKGMKTVLDSLVNSQIYQLNFNHINEQFEMGLKLEYKHMKPIQHLQQLKILLMDLNKIEVIEPEVFGLIPKSTEFIAMSGNRLTYGKYVSQLHTMTHITGLDISYQHLNYDPFIQDHYERYSNFGVSNFYLEQCKHYRSEAIDKTASVTKCNSSSLLTSCSKCLFDCLTHGIPCVCAPPNLKNLKWRKSFVYFHVMPFKICAPTSLETVDLSFNLILEWTGPVYGLENLKHLNLEENFCQNMSTYFFDTFYGLTYLNVSYNLLGPILKPNGENDGKHFKNLTNLQELDLSENRITSLSTDIFKNLKSLKYLNLSRNMLSEWNSTLETNCLRFLDLSENKLETLPDSLREYLDKVAALSQTESCGRAGDVTVRLSRNPIQCNCDSRPFLRWLFSSPVNIHFHYTDECHLQDGSRISLIHKDVISNFVKHLDRECFPYVSIIVSVLTFIIGIVLCFVVYRYRWKLRHWYYSKRKRHRHRGYDRLFDRDAFISYASSEGRFIKRFLVPALEEQRGLKVWVADRDSLPGLSVAENLAHAINFSKKTVLLLSRKYFKEVWCDYEMNLARIESVESQRELFVIVLFEDIAPREIPLDYLRLIQKEQLIEYPRDPEDQDTFWDLLCSSIKNE